MGGARGARFWDSGGMPRLPLVVPWMLAMLALSVLLSAGERTMPGPSTEAAAKLEATAEVLRGTWLREYSDKGMKVRRVLVLEASGAFRETARVASQAGEVTEFVHEGTWLYDGTNLKRKYTSMNGKPPSRLNVPFATFEIAFASRNEFDGVDHIHGHRVHYRRVGSDKEL
jgi:hypothetical protein